MRKLISLLLCLVLVNAMAVPALAAEQYTYLDTIEVYLDFNDFWGVANCSGTADCYDGNDIKVETTLQMYGDNGWEDLKTWTNTGTYSVNASGSWAVARGEQYRVYVTAYIYDDNGWIVEADTQTLTKYF